MVAPFCSGRLNPMIRCKAQQSIVILTLQILYDAWPATAADSRVNCDSKEDSITDVLRWKMSEAKNRLDPVPQMRFERESQSDRTQQDTPTGLIDIMVSYTWDESNYLTMECKRVRSDENSLALAYVRNGVNRFASGKYAPGHAFGIVVGYVICSNPAGCVERVRAALEKEPAVDSGFDAKHGWQPDKRLLTASNLYRTRHTQRALKNHIQLLHSFHSMI